MSVISRHSRILIVAVSCAVIGAGAGAIASAGASTSPATAAKAGRAHAGRVQGLRRWERRGGQGGGGIPTKHGRDNGQRSTLSNVKDGQRVIVVTAPKNTFVVARTPRKP